MAKGKSKNKEKKQTFNAFLKDRYFAIILGNFEKIYSTLDYESQLNLVYAYKDLYLNFISELNDTKFLAEEIDVLNFLGYIEELFLIQSLKKSEYSTIIKKIRNKIVEYMKKTNSCLQLVLTINKATKYINLEGDKNLILFQIMLTYFISYCSCYVVTYKNRVVKDIVMLEDRTLNIDYTATPYLSEIEMEKVVSKECSKNLLDSIIYKATSFTKTFLLGSVLDVESILNLSTPIQFKSEVRNFPLKNNGSYLIDDSFLFNFYNLRKYAIPYTGVVLDVIDTTKDVERITVNENELNFVVIIHLKINENVIVESFNYKKTFPIVCYVSKTFNIENPSGNDFILANQFLFNAPIKDILYLALASIYVVICDTKIMLSHFRVSERNKSTHLKTRESGYRVGHIRRLSGNSKMSKEAFQNAKREGFSYIPEGYTFVRSSGIDKLHSDSPKTIKIK